MRFSIGLRLFAAVLLAILAVAATAIALLRQNVLGSFADYAVKIELDRLGELSASLTGKYGARGGWQFLPAGDAARRGYIAAELGRLQDERAQGIRIPVPPVPPVPKAADAAPAILAPAAGATASGSRTPPAVARTPEADDTPADPPTPLTPPAPPAPPAPMAPLPPLPPPAIAAAGADAGATARDAPLQDRITLLDQNHRYLAGQPPAAVPTAERALDWRGRTIGYLAVTRAARPSDLPALAFLGQLKGALGLIVPLAVLLSAVAASLLAAHFRKPIHQLADGARELAAGRFDQRIAVARSDELGELARSFNQLAERLDALERSRRQWVADTSHELRTPLSVLRAQLEAIQDGVRQADGATVAAMLRQVLSLNTLIDELYLLARADVGELACRRDPLDLCALAREEAQAFSARLQSAGLTLDLPPGPALPVAGDSERLRQVLRNLLENAVRYTSAGGTVRVSCARDDASAVLTLDDSAPGVPDAALAHLSERFYRVDASRSRAQGGAGLGLALCERIVQAHGGSLGFEHSPLGGLRVTVRLPLQSA
ncbi:MAG TPA: ATP-binding protein [Telluria sp.]|nr:ATP-binding protein [Telluria sp.]